MCWFASVCFKNDEDFSIFVQMINICKIYELEQLFSYSSFIISAFLVWYSSSVISCLSYISFNFLANSFNVILISFPDIILQNWILFRLSSTMSNNRNTNGTTANRTNNGNMNNDTRGTTYNATRTATAGTTDNTWTWIVVIIAAIAIVALL